MRIIRRQVSPKERGYSLIEMLVVVAIVGILALVTVPNFMSMYRSSKLKTSMRQFTNHVRAARQSAVTRATLVRIAFVNNSRLYYIFQSEDQGTTWDPLGTNPKYLDETVFFENSTGATKFSDAVDDGGLGDLPDIIFDRTGVARVSGGSGVLKIKSTFEDIGRTEFTVNVRSSGAVNAQ